MISTQINEIIVYQPDETLKLDVQVEGDTVWLTQTQMVELFQTSKQNISLHINNIFKEGELDADTVVKKYLTVHKIPGFHSSESCTSLPQPPTEHDSHQPPPRRRQYRHNRKSLPQIPPTDPHRRSRTPRICLPPRGTGIIWIIRILIVNLKTNTAFPNHGAQTKKHQRHRGYHKL